MATRLASFKRRATSRRPLLYVNDNFGRWRSDFRWTIALAQRRARRAGACRGGCARRRVTTSSSHPSTRGSTTRRSRPCSRLDPPRHRHRHRRQHLRAVHRERRLHARPEDRRADRLRRLQHGRGQRLGALRQIELVLKGNIAPSTLLEFRCRRRAGRRGTLLPLFSLRSVSWQPDTESPVAGSTNRHSCRRDFHSRRCLETTHASASTPLARARARPRRAHGCPATAARRRRRRTTPRSTPAIVPKVR